MKTLTLILSALLITGCGVQPVAQEPNNSESTAEQATTEPSSETPESTPEVDPKAEAEKALEEALSQPDPAPPALGDPETLFLEAYKVELETLPEGPHTQLGTDVDSVNLGYQACSDLSGMSYGEALFAYAFTDVTEEQVADYNAALNAAPGTLC